MAHLLGHVEKIVKLGIDVAPRSGIVIHMPRSHPAPTHQIILTKFLLISKLANVVETR